MLAAMKVTVITIIREYVSMKIGTLIIFSGEGKYSHFIKMGVFIEET
jgi:hypothetical protein